MEHVSIDMQVRDVVGKKVRRLRREGWIPATVYGKGVMPISVQVNERDFQKIYQQVGRTSLVSLNIPGKPAHVAFIQDIQRHPVWRTILHADFRVVDLKIAINTEVPVVLVGSSPLLDRGDAVINQGLTHLEVHALPEDLPQHIEVDLSILDSFDKSIHVADLQVGAAYSFITSGDALVAALTHTRMAVTAEGEEEGQAAREEPALIRKEREEAE
jgi:large subunit ribosomal protein L25